MYVRYCGCDIYMAATVLWRCTADSNPSLHISSDLVLAAVVTRKEKKKKFASSFSLSRHPTSTSALRGQKMKECVEEMKIAEREKKEKKKSTTPYQPLSEKENLLPPLLETKMQDQATACGPSFPRKARNKPLLHTSAPAKLFFPLASSTRGSDL